MVKPTPIEGSCVPTQASILPQAVDREWELLDVLSLLPQHYISIRDFVASKTDKAYFNWTWVTSSWAAQLRAGGKRSCWSIHHPIHPQPLSTTHTAKKQGGDGLGHLAEVRVLLIYTSTGSGLMITTCPRLLLHQAKWRWKDGKQSPRTKCTIPTLMHGNIWTRWKGIRCFFPPF